MVYAYRSLGARAVGSRDSLASAPSKLWKRRCARRGALVSQSPTRSVGIYISIVGRAGACIRLSLRINISLIIEEIYKIVEDFLTQFNLLYLPMIYYFQTSCIVTYIKLYVSNFFYTSSKLFLLTNNGNISLYFLFS